MGGQLLFHLRLMKQKGKFTVSNNHTLDQYLKPKQLLPSKPDKEAIRVPPSSGLAGLTVPDSAVLRYPLRPEWRSYQQQIVNSCICNNTLVCLPTGLGKTHVAAVVIANFARWFPQQKIIFLAPTRPLVRQQLSALRNMQDQVAPEQVLEVSGQLPAHKRTQLYETHQVVFATPQTIENDLENGRIDGRRVVLLVFDECHRAVGNFSYCQIIKLMNRLDVGFRVVGLSATPGSEHEKVQEVISRLNISRIVYRDEHEPEVSRYLHSKTLHEVEIPENGIIKEALAHLEKFAAPSLGLLTKLQILEPWMIRKGLAGTSFYLIREKFGERIDSVEPGMKALAFAAFKILCFLSRCRKSLNDQGYQTFKLQFFSEIEPPKPAKLQSQSQPSKISENSNDKSNTARTEEEGEVTLSEIYGYYPEASVTTSKAKAEGSKMSLPRNFRTGMLQSKEYKRLYQMFHRGVSNHMHPKLSKLAEILQSFFAQQQGKAMVFTQLRISAKEIKEYLSTVEGVRSQLFFGQSKTMGEDEETGQSFCLQLRQRDQLELIEKYKRGEVNTLVSTSIGEEGLDIGEVDCIVCYDGGHSPIRAIQRRGRTGRKRAGEVYMLLMEGKQTADYRKGLKKEAGMKDLLRKQAHTFHYFSFNSSLFHENTLIPIELYDNEVMDSAKKTKVKVPPLEPAKETKKPKRKTKNIQEAKEEAKQVQEADPHQMPINQGEQQVQLNITTMSQLLMKYKEDNVEEPPLYTNQLSLPTTELLPIDYDQSSRLSLATQAHSSSDEEEGVLVEYFKQKQKERESGEQSTILERSSSSDSTSSDELLSMLQNLHKKRQLADLPSLPSPRRHTPKN